MPIYEFNCKACRKKFEKICRSGILDQEINCPQCGKNTAKRCFSTFAVSSGAKTESSSSGSAKSSCSSCASHSCSSCH